MPEKRRTVSASAAFCSAHEERPEELRDPDFCRVDAGVGNRPFSAGSPPAPKRSGVSALAAGSVFGAVMCAFLAAALSGGGKREAAPRADGTEIVVPSPPVAKESSGAVLRLGGDGFGPGMDPEAAPAAFVTREAVPPDYYHSPVAARQTPPVGFYHDPFVPKDRADAKPADKGNASALKPEGQALRKEPAFSPPRAEVVSEPVLAAPRISESREPVLAAPRVNAARKPVLAEPRARQTAEASPSDRTARDFSKASPDFGAVEALVRSGGLSTKKEPKAAVFQKASAPAAARAEALYQPGPSSWTPFKGGKAPSGASAVYEQASYEEPVSARSASADKAAEAGAARRDKGLPPGVAGRVFKAEDVDYFVDPETKRFYIVHHSAASAERYAYAEYRKKSRRLLLVTAHGVRFDVGRPVDDFARELSGKRDVGVLKTGGSFNQARVYPLAISED